MKTIKLHTVFSPLTRVSNFISENCNSTGSALKAITRIVSPSELLTEIVLSSEPKANRPSEFQDPHVIFFECFPIMGTLLVKIKFKVIKALKK